MTTYKFSNHDINKFILLLQKDCEMIEFNDSSIPLKEDF